LTFYRFNSFLIYEKAKYSLRVFYRIFKEEHVDENLKAFQAGLISFDHGLIVTNSERNAKLIYLESEKNKKNLKVFPKNVLKVRSN
jgi:hypothetical protein